MSKFDDYKRIIFSDTASQDALLAAMRKRNGTGTVKTFDEAYHTLFKETKDNKLQRILAPFLRALAIKQLRDGNTITVRNIKQEYTNVMGKFDTVEDGDAPTFEALLNEQSKNGVYAIDLIGIALADALDVTFIITVVDDKNIPRKTKNNQTVTYTCYEAPSKDAPSVHLFNKTNEHFFIIEGDYNGTIGDGNCLFNGFAQSCAQQIRYEQNQESSLSDSDVYTYQQTRYEEIKKLHPISTKDLVQAYCTNLSVAEKIDHDLAIQISREELSNAARTKAKVSHFETLITLIEKKAGGFSSIHQETANKARALATTLTATLGNYKTGKITCEQFKEQSLQAIDVSKTWLEPHRDWKNILINLAVAVLGFGIPLLYNRVTAGHWFFKMPTDLSSELTNVKQEIECLNDVVCGC